MRDAMTGEDPPVRSVGCKAGKVVRLAAITLPGLADASAAHFMCGRAGTVRLNPHTVIQLLQNLQLSVMPLQYRATIVTRTG